MPTLSTAARNAACDAIVDLIDQPGGAGSGTGRIRITTASDASTLATIAFTSTAFGNAATGTATLNGVPLSDTSADNTGTAAEFYIESDSGGTPTTVISGSVDVSGNNPDIDIDNTSITAGQTVNLTSLTVTVPAAP